MQLRVGSSSLAMRQRSPAAGRSVPVARPNIARRCVSSSWMEEIEVEAPKNQHPNPAFIKSVLEAFPDAGVANVEEALVLFLEGGYKFLDVRSDRERDFGAIKNSIHVPYTKDKKEFTDGGMKVTKTKMDAEAWLKAVNAKILRKDTKIIVHDMIGKKYGLECLELLFENGYENVVGLKGGFKPWFKTFDFNLRRRYFGEYQENATQRDSLASGDSCGIHASGAGFENQDRLSGDFWDQFDRIV